MRNLGRWIAAVLAQVLRNPDSSQSHDFTSVSKSVSALVALSLMAQYPSHTPDTLVYIERYLETFHQPKVIFLQLGILKATGAEANHEDRDLR